MATDQELLGRWGDGDMAAGGELFDRYFAQMVRFFENKGCRDVEDLVQNTFLACVQSRDRFRADSSFRTFLFGIARNKLYEHLRRHYRHGGALDFGVTSLAALNTGPRSKLARNQDHHQLLDALCQLPLDQQLLLEMYYWQEMDLGDLAEIFAVKRTTVRTRLFRARQALRERLADTADPAGPVGPADSPESFDTWARALRARRP